MPIIAKMKLYQLQRIQSLPISRNEAWQFFSQPLNLPEITPAWPGFRLNTAVPDRMFAGMVILYRIKPFFGIPSTWISEITHVDEPEYVIDEQRIGPYRFWHHRHTFKPLDNGTQIKDIVHYAIGFGMLGPWVQRLMVAPRLDNIFNYRYERLKHIFSANTRE